MKIDLSPYAGKTIAVACSGGKDSMALLHYLLANASQYAIQVCVVNCDHSIRGESSVRDSKFVIDYCKAHSVSCYPFVAPVGLLKSEEEARLWRYSCFVQASKPQSLFCGKWGGFDFLACAHHQSDNAETVLLNLSRGAGLKGVSGIAATSTYNGIQIIRPLLFVSQEEILDYITKNKIEYVTDESNLRCDYTRNKLRHEVLPALERAVPGATAAICRFAALARVDEEYFSRCVDAVFTDFGRYGIKIAECDLPIFSRAVIRAMELWHKKDYTSQHISKIFALAKGDTGKKFCFLGITACKEKNAVTLVQDIVLSPLPPIPFSEFIGGRKEYGGQPLQVGTEGVKGQKVLRFDRNALPPTAVVRYMQDGDRFTPFGGGEKSLGDFFTDRKIPYRLRKQIPLIADDHQILTVVGVEIARQIKISDQTGENVQTISSPDYELYV